MNNQCVDLDMYYQYQFVQNETARGENDKCAPSRITTHKLGWKHLLADTLTGTAYVNGVAVNTFSPRSGGGFTITAITRDEAQPFVQEVSADWDAGVVTLTWSRPVRSGTIVVSYEYDYGCENCAKPAEKLNITGGSVEVTLTQNGGHTQSEDAPKHGFVLPTFETFFSGEELMEIIDHCGTRTVWDFNTSLGESIGEKYESLYVKCVEVTEELIRNGAKGYFWIATSAEISSIFETAYGFCHASRDSAGFEPQHRIGGVMPMGIPMIVIYAGAVHEKWRIYRCSQIPANQILIGCNDRREHASHYGRISVANFVI